MGGKLNETIIDKKQFSLQVLSMQNNFYIYISFVYYLVLVSSIFYNFTMMKRSKYKR